MIVKFNEFNYRIIKFNEFNYKNVNLRLISCIIIIYLPNVREKGGRVNDKGLVKSAWVIICDNF